MGMTEELEKALDERKNYGDYKVNSMTVQEMKTAMFCHPNWSNLEPHQKESLEMIVHKIGRVLGGDNSAYSDSMLDIAGYAKLFCD